MTGKFEKIFKKYNVPENMEEYIFGKVPIYNVGKDLWYYYWESLISEIYEEEGLNSEYTKRVFELMFKYERHESYDIYFSLFSHDTENYIKSIKYLNNVMNVDLSRAVYEYLKFKNSLNDNFELLKSFYENNKDAVRLVLLRYYKNFTSGSGAGGFTYRPTDNILSYLMGMKEIDYEFLKEKIINRIDKLYDYDLMSFYVYLPFFKDGERKNILLRVISRYLNERNVSDDIKNVVLEYLKTGKKNKKFDKLVKKIATHNKKYNTPVKLSDMILYKKPDPADIYEQRLITLSMHIDKYRTIKRFLFSIYSDEDKMKTLRNELTYEVDKSNMDELIKNWESINYENIIDYLTHHIAIEFYGLEAKKFLKQYLKEDFDKVLSALGSISGKGLDIVLDILYEHNKEKTNEFILDNIATFKGKSLINKVVEILQQEKSNHKKLINLIKHKKSNVREIAVRTLLEINDKNDFKFLKTAMSIEKSKKIKDMIIEYLIADNIL